MGSDEKELVARIKANENTFDASRTLYLSAPVALRSPLLQHELIVLVAQHARLECELHNLRVKQAS